MFRSGQGALICCAVLSACGGGERKADDAPVAQTVRQESRASPSVGPDLAAKVAALEARVTKLQGEQIAARFSGPQGTVLFDPQDEKKYQPVKAPGGPVLVMLEKVEPYLDGFVVSMSIGNPSAGGYAGLHANVKWGRAYDAAKDDAYNELAEKEIELSDFLPSGAWTVVKFNIAPAQVDQVRRILFSPVFNAIRLRGPVLQ